VIGEYSGELIAPLAGHVEDDCGRGDRWLFHLGNGGASSWGAARNC